MGNNLIKSSKGFIDTLRIDSGNIMIKVTPNYEYEVHSMVKMGNPDDRPGVFSAYGWVNHLREKIWWNNELESNFLLLAKRIIDRNGR